MGALITMRRTLGFKLETVAYSPENSLAVADYNVPAYNINYDVDVPVKDRKLARGDFSHDVGVAGKRAVTISFSVDITKGAAAATDATYFKCLQACGMKKQTWGATGVTLIPHADYSNVPATIEVVEKDEGTSPVQLVIRTKGCMGNAKLVGDGVGSPMRIDFEFKGALESIYDRTFATLVGPTGFDTTIPEVILSVTGNLFNESQRFDKITIDIGNQVEMFSLPSHTSGYEGAHIISRDSIIELDPDMAILATNGQAVRHYANTRGAFSMAIGQNFTVTAPQAQIIQSYKPGEREGHVVNNLRLRTTRDAVGNDDLVFRQGTTA